MKFDNCLTPNHPKYIEIRCPIDGMAVKHRLEILYRNGHIGLRVGKRRYQMSRKSARSTSFVRWINLTSRLKDNDPVIGLIIPASRDQMNKVEAYFQKQISRSPAFRTTRRNCAQEVCRALHSAGIEVPHRLIAIVPRLTYQWFLNQPDVTEIRRYSK